MSTNVVGVDMGGTKILSAVIDAEGNILGTAKVPTKADEGTAVVIDRIADAIQKAIGKSGVNRASIEAVGIGAPGPLDPETGVVIFAPNLGWRDVPLKAELEARVGIPTFVDNDVNVGTLGEHAFGAGKGVQNIVGIFVGTGIGGGIILHGELFHGASKTAGEIGHIIVKADGPRCGCGRRGCLEALASRTAMTKQFQKAIEKKGKKSVISKLTDGDLSAIRSGVLAKAIRAKDKLTLKVFKKATKYLGIGIGSIVNFLNPEMIILGGGVVEALDDTFLDNIRAAAEKYALPNTLDGVQIVRAELGDNSGILGAAALARQRFFNH
ncbi:ROK family glucokinase [Candidatus Poribacteria bacterium]|nr:ROK family glucokinase [Candidatus Poribacteria bacterium]MYH79196.1 ROK family glucokinase [Candidatus Poribacteria bacterium]MYK92397.1 ROK family glucokinase [Candidatus Poribacteria bacterium]